MNINKNNYEEYFLLYTDNELSEQEKNAVDNFVKLNPELEPEFNMIQLTVNIPDENVRFDKSFLLKNELASFINLHNYEEVFVLYYDGELDETQRVETDEFVTLHPELKGEFELFGQTLLSADTSIIFPNKEVLYRKEKAAKVIPIMAWRLLAAAVFIGFGIWVAQPYLTQKRDAPTVVANDNSIKSSAIKTDSNEVASIKNSGVNTPEVSSVKEGSEKNPLNNEHDKNQLAVSQTRKKTKPELVSKAKEPSFIDDNLRELKKDETPVLIASNDVRTELPGIDKTPIQYSNDKNESHIDQVDPVIQTIQSAKNASYASLTEETSTDGNYVFYNVSADEFRKSKVGGFLKKVKRMVERTNPIAQIFSGNDNQIASK